MSGFKVNGKRGDVKHNVRILLTNYESLRNDKLRCVTFYWFFINAAHLKIDLKAISAHEFMVLYLEGKFEHQASIERMWQRVQEEDVKLRGSNWEKRQKHSRTVINDLNS